MEKLNILIKKELLIVCGTEAVLNFILWLIMPFNTFLTTQINFFKPFHFQNRYFRIEFSSSMTHWKYSSPHKTQSFRSIKQKLYSWYRKIEIHNEIPKHIQPQFEYQFQSKSQQAEKSSELLRQQISNKKK